MPGTRRARLAPGALQDVRDAVFWLEERNPAAADGFLEAVYDATERIAEFPDAGLRRADLLPDRIRLHLLRAFSYELVYRLDRDPPVVLRVLYAARDLPPIFEKLVFEGVEE